MSDEAGFMVASLKKKGNLGFEWLLIFTSGLMDSALPTQNTHTHTRTHT